MKKDQQYLVDKLQGHISPFEGLFGFSAAKGKEGEKFDGTIFRFPLRTEGNAKWSEISSASYSQEDARRLVTMVEKSAKLFLLFLQFVNKVRVCIWEAGESEMKDLVSYERHFDVGADVKISQVLFHSEIKFNSAYSVSIKDQKCSDNEIERWDIFVNAPGKKSSDGTLCIAAVAFPSASLDLQTYTQSRLLFCFLPLPQPEDTGLPFLINGTFAVHSSRRFLEVSTMDDKSEEKSNDGAWNRDILELGATEALCDAIKTKSLQENVTQNTLFKLFPHDSTAKDAFCKVFIKAFYEKLVNDQTLAVFEAVNHRSNCSLSESGVCLLDASMPSEVRESLSTFLSFQESSEIWLQLPVDLIEMLCKEQPHEIGPKLRNFSDVLTLIIPHLSKSLETPDGRRQVRTISHYILATSSQLDPRLVDYLKGAEWILTEVDEQFVLKKPNELVSPKSQLAELVSFSNEFFPSKELELAVTQLKVLVSLFELNETFLPRLAFPRIVENLNSITDHESCASEIKKYFHHLNNNEAFYGQLDIEVCQNLLIPIEG